MKIKNLKEIKKEGNPTLNMIIYGDSGVGKTTLAATAAKLGKVLYIDAEAGSKFIDEKFAENIDILKLENASQLEEVLKSKELDNYETVVLDSITEIMKKMIDLVKGTKERPTLQDWGTIITKMETYFRRFRDLGKNVLLVALTTEKDDDGIILKRPSLSGKNLPSDIIGFQDVCLYLENTVHGRVGHVQPSQKFYAKDRTNKLGEKIEQKNLNIEYILEKISSKPEPASKEQLEEIYSFVEKEKIKPDDMNKMAEYGGASIIEELDYVGAEKVIKALNLKYAS